MSTPGKKVPNPQVAVNIQKASSDLLDKTSTLERRVTSDSVKSALGILQEIGIKDDIENFIRHVDPDTPAERNAEAREITLRIFKLDRLLTFLLYYTSLALNCLTLLGPSKSFGDFMYNVFIKSFDVTEWDFLKFTTVGKISGATCTLQVGFFIIANALVLVYTRLHPRGEDALYKGLRGPIYFGGPLQIFHLFGSSLKSYYKAVRKSDAQFADIINFISQTLIVVVTALSSHSKYEVLETEEGPESSSSFFRRQFPVDNSTVEPTETELQNQAMIAQSTLVISSVAIIMLSLLNMLSWLSNIWTVEQDEVIVYALFKLITRILVCYPCCKDKFVGDGQDAKDIEKEKLMEKGKSVMRGNI
ncbi:3848_t:CDS:1 [Paraglomus occultum]|uniref:3848_t:CDS:1 n=1 Tax=Paraglomus occultum TaxID=144539 RepID=A0A9N8W313_9GLOM|nr:3848_t:CDS:1 [Paraglomus occultum]